MSAWRCVVCNSEVANGDCCSNCGVPYIKSLQDYSTLSYTEQVEYDSNGHKIVKNYDTTDGNLLSVTTYTDDNTYSEKMYSKNGKVAALAEYHTKSNVKVSFYNEEGKKVQFIEDTKSKLTVINYGSNELMTSKTEEYTDGRITEELYDNKGGIRKRTKYNLEGEKNIERYKNGKLLEESCYRGDEYDELVYNNNYEYNDKGQVVKKTMHTKILKEDLADNQYVDVLNVHSYKYDEYGNVVLKNEFIVDDKKIIEFSSDDITMEYYDGQYTFLNQNSNTACIVDELGNIEYTFDNGVLSLNNDGTFNNSEQNISGKYHFDSDNNIVCIDNNGNEYVYNNMGQILKKTNDNEVREYDYEKDKETTIYGVNRKYNRINHIEYDEEAYHGIMQSLINIGQTSMQGIESACSSIDSIINSMTPEKYGGNTSGIKGACQAQINEINNLNSCINYALLAYDACDEALRFSIDSNLIDNLFDPSESNIEKLFKENINLHIEDRNNDGIFEYKEDTDFKELTKTIIPAYTYEDSKGNKWYLNSDKKLISADGNNLKIMHGDTEFNVSFTDNGIVKLTDTNGNPINIFGDYNNQSDQYGGSQTALRDVSLLYDENIMKVISKYYPYTNYEEREQLLDIAATHGCGYTAVTNAVFKNLEGQEDKFYNLFGYPMYNVIVDDYSGAMRVDYNYEPTILELFCELNGKDEVIEYGINNGAGSSDITYKKMREFVYNKYGLKLGDDSSSCPLYDAYGVFGDAYYKVYDMNNNLVIDGNTLPKGGSHAMTKISEITENKWVVSTWGHKAICEVNSPTSH